MNNLRRILADEGLTKTARSTERDVLKALSSNPNVPWTTTEIWAETQNKWPRGLVKDILREEAEWEGWPENDYEMQEMSDRIYEDEIAPINRLALSMWKKGILTRTRVRGGGGEWALPGTRGSESTGGMSYEDWTGPRPAPR